MAPGTHQKSAPPDRDALRQVAVPATCRAGGMIVFDSTLWHAAGHNTSGKDRKDLARWIFLAMAAHPEMKQHASANASTLLLARASSRMNIKLRDLAKKIADGSRAARHGRHRADRGPVPRAGDWSSAADREGSDGT